ncbi:MAG: flavocytochrome c [Limnochordia bacterium]|nr:flavocytochrome c [Bacillota bacterium]
MIRKTSLMLTLILVVTLIGYAWGSPAKTINTDVVVVGAGGAGLTAAITAKEAGADVVVVEKMMIIGGNTLRATGGLNAAGTVYQDKAGIKDSPDVHYEDTMKGGRYENVPELVRTMVDNAAAAVEWLNDLGANLIQVNLSGGSTNARSHAPEGGGAVGPAVVMTLQNAAKERGIEVLTQTKAAEVLVEGGQVAGIRCETKDGELIVKAKAVVIATGGYGANPDMVVKYRPDLKGFATTNHPGATGDGIDMAIRIGAATCQIGSIQTHPTVVPVSGIMITEAVRGQGAILINREGKRFIDELQTRDVVSEAILAQEGGSAFLVFDQGVRERLKAIEDYANQGLLTEAGSLQELGDKLGVSGEVLAETVAGYNKFVADKSDPDCGRQHLDYELNKAPYYAVEVTPAVHHTMGGLAINTKAEVLDEDGKAIPGLYAAGEVTGGVHGANRLGGNAVADIIVYGRIAGAEAAAFSGK